MASQIGKLVNKQFNSPIKLYSENNIREVLDRETQLLGNGAVGINFHNPLATKPANLQHSAVLRFLEEEEQQRKRGGSPNLKRVAWPPPPEGEGHLAEIPLQDVGGSQISSPGLQTSQAPSVNYQHQGQTFNSQERPQLANQHNKITIPISSQLSTNHGPSSPNLSPSGFNNTTPPIKQWAPVYSPSALSPQPNFSLQEKHNQATPFQPAANFNQYQATPPQYQTVQQQYQPSPHQYQQTPTQQYQPTPQQYQPTPPQQYQPILPEQYQTTVPQYQTPPQQYQPTYQGYHQPLQQYEHPQQFSQPSTPTQFQATAQPQLQSQLQQPQLGAPQQRQGVQQQPTQQIAKPVVEPPPTTITLRPQAPVSQAPAPVYNSQPATATLKGGKNLRGDLKWPPPDTKAQMEAENRARIELAKGPVFRPRKVKRDYSGFFAQHALNNTYPGYKIPPGTQFYAQ